MSQRIFWILVYYVALISGAVGGIVGVMMICVGTLISLFTVMTGNEIDAEFGISLLCIVIGAILFYFAYLADKFVIEHQKRIWPTHSPTGE